MMIEAFYNLKSLPFGKNISPDKIFLSASAAELRKRLEYMLSKRGLFLITGLPGTGKTLNVRAFISSLNPNLFKPFYIPLATVSTMEFHQQLCSCLTGEIFWRKNQNFKAIQLSIKDYVQNQKKVPIIIFDEAHFLKNENFYELQIISNIEMDSLQPALFIIISQPHLRERLLRPIHQAFYQRIDMHFVLTPLARDESSAYIAHQLSLSGRDDPIFDSAALKAIFQNSGGIPRMINKICIKSLTIGALEKKETLSAEEVFRSTREL